jgi:protein-disulfide isomerase
MPMKGFSPTMKTVLRTLAIAVLMVAISGFAQAGDTSVLRPPKGSKVAIIVFEDLECPQCAHVEPLLDDAVKNYKIPLVRYDFPLSQHPWSFQAHVTARYFDTKSKALGEEFRRWVFANQRFITQQNFSGMADRFATEHHVTVPAFVDPKGELAAKVKDDAAIGQRVGIDHTPTIYVVSDSQKTPYIEVKEQSQLFSTIDQMMALVKAEAPAPRKSSSARVGKPAQ